jgi:hypothetical protein
MSGAEADVGGGDVERAEGEDGGRDEVEASAVEEDDSVESMSAHTWDGESTVETHRGDEEGSEVLRGEGGVVVWMLW